MLASDEIGGDVVEPDHVAAVDGDAVAAPDVFGVDVGEAHVLDDDVLCAADDADSFAFDHALRALSDQTLVRPNGQAEHARLVVRDLADLGRVGLLAAAPVAAVDGDLAPRAGSPGSTASGCGGALGAGEVEGLGEDDDAGGGVGEVVLELGGG